jgi:integral membrane protein (TIGR01906 family)
VGPGSFELVGPDGRPFYDTAERGHLRDARVLLRLCVTAGAISVVVLGLLVRLTITGAPRRSIWSAVSRAGATAAVAVVLIGIVGLVAFDSLFTLFHQVFFPAGGWSFDPSTQRLVQLYPVTFWQVAAAAFGLLLGGLGVLTWWLGRAMAAPDR